MRGGARRATPRKKQNSEDPDECESNTSETARNNHIGSEGRGSNCHPKESTASEPAEEAASGRRVGTRRVDVVVHRRAANAPAAHVADAEEGDVDRARAARGALPQAMPGPRLARRRALAQVTKN